MSKSTSTLMGFGSLMSSLKLDDPSSSSDGEVEAGDCGTSEPKVKPARMSCEYCGQEMLCFDRNRYYCSPTCCEKLERKQEIQPESRFKRVSIVGRGGTGVLKTFLDADFLVINMNVTMGSRDVLVNNSFRVHNKRMTKGTQTPTKPENRKQEEKDDSKEKLKALMNFGSDSSDDSDDDDDDELPQHDNVHEDVYSLFGRSRGVNDSICEHHPPLSAFIVKGHVISVSNPWEIYVQTDEMSRKLKQIDSILNGKKGIDKRLVLKNWKPEIGGYCAAKFVKYDNKLYRAKILEYLPESETFIVKFVDYGKNEMVKVKDVMQLNPEVALTPRQCIYFRMSNVKPLDGKVWGMKARKFMLEHVSGDSVELRLENIYKRIVHAGKLYLTSSLSKKVKEDLGTKLIEKKLAEPDVYAIYPEWFFDMSQWNYDPPSEQRDWN